MAFELIHTLSESMAFRSEDTLQQYSDDQLTALLFMYVIAMCVLGNTPKTKQRAVDYINTTLTFSNFNMFRSITNDLYTLAYNKNKDKYFRDRVLIDILNSIRFSQHQSLYFFLNQLRRDLGVSNITVRNFVIPASEWHKVNDVDKKRIIDQLIYEIARIIPRSDIVDDLKKALPY